jgi:Domain of unknown function (DUF6089)
MRNKLFFIVLVFLLFPLLMDAQGTSTRRRVGGFSTLKSHKASTEYIFGIGAANFLGELGGADQFGTNFLKDFEFKASRPSTQISIRYKFQKYWAVRGGFYYFRVSGADSLTKEVYRQNRNLSFQADIFEISGQAEFFFLNKEQPARRYKIKGAKGIKNFQLNAYVFCGVGMFFYNPKAKYNGKWVSLHSLGTEGQGLPGGPKPYSRFSVAIPYGFGFKQPIGSEWSVGLEFGARKTYSDYIDDVSDKYYSNSDIYNQRGATAAALADPKLYGIHPSLVDKNNPLGYNQGAKGEQRGDVLDLDSYLFVNLTFVYKIMSNSSGVGRGGGFAKAKHRSLF